MAVAGFNGSIGSLARADTLHPVAHICGRLRIGSSVGCGRSWCCVLGERKAVQQVWLHVHFRGGARAQSARGSYGLFVHIDHAAIRVIKFLNSARRVSKSRRILYLETFAQIVERAVIEHRGHRIPVLASVLPQINASIGDHAARMRQPGEPMDCVDLVDKPLVGNAG